MTTVEANGVARIARMLGGISRQRVMQLVNDDGPRHDPMPKPDVTVYHDDGRITVGWTEKRLKLVAEWHQRRMNTKENHEH